MRKNTWLLWVLVLILAGLAITIAVRNDLSFTNAVVPIMIIIAWYVESRNRNDEEKPKNDQCELRASENPSGKEVDIEDNEK